MARAFPWSRLGIDPTSDKAAIRKAYADVLRAINPDEDIAGYAELRRARDHALWLAAQAERAPEPEPDADEGELYGLGTLDDDVGDDDAALWDDDPADAWWDVGGPAQAEGPVDTAPAPAPELTEAQQRAQAAWNRMLAVLYPDGEPSDGAVSHAELDEGLAALDVLIARAEEADIEEHDALDSALAELFARTWPRSAPFVEPANVAFHWIGEAGSLDERPALRFLNDRIKGMRFHEKVQQPDHPLHKAWAELSRPGRAGVLDRLRVKRLDVHKLLVGVRERYPELEAFLDPERVASWEGSGAGSAEGYTSARKGFSGTLIFVLLFFALMRGLGALVGPDGDPASDNGAPPVEEAAAALKAAQYDIAVSEAFGPDLGMAAVRKADPVLAADLRSVVDNAGFGPGIVLAVVRGKALRSGEVADFEGLVARAELKRLWLAEARKSPELCNRILRGDFETERLLLEPDARERERVLLKRLLDAKFLSGKATSEGGSFSVPGWVIEKTIAVSGLSPDTVSAALRGPEHAARCQLEYAMLGVMLKEPGKVPAGLLRAL
jgi:hypothetical protein